MIFSYHQKSGDKKIKITNQSFIHLFKAQRKKVGEEIILRNLKDNFNYYYFVEEVLKKKAILIFQKKEKIKNNFPVKNFNLGWCLIDPKKIKEVLPYLNQMGLKKITFIKSDFSQKNFKIKKESLEKILINSCEQCGRNDLMEINFEKSIENFLKNNPNSYLLNFNGLNLEKEKKKINSLIIGPEGGFSEREVKLFSKNKILSFQTSNVLRSENATISAVAKILI